MPNKNLSIYKKAYNHLDLIAQRLNYPNSASRDLDALERFIEEELYKRLDYANYNIRSKNCML